MGTGDTSRPPADLGHQPAADPLDEADDERVAHHEGPPPSDMPVAVQSSGKLLSC
jgi:hypothetical protein